MENAASVIDYMFARDLFSKQMGMEIVNTGEGYSKVKMKITNDMLNGFGVIHGGVTFSLADSAFAFACNSRNNLSVAMDVTISFIKSVHPGDELVAEAKEIHNGRSTGIYLVTIINQNNEQVALFKGTCFRTQKNLI